jgi:hypothetical protein
VGRGTDNADRAVRGLTATLEDELRDRPGGRVAWSTGWKLCWAEHPHAQAYELQVLTAEGRSPRLRRQRARCYEVEVAAGENRRSRVLVNRELQLALTRAQLAYRVRAVLADGSTTRWSETIEAGRPIRVRTSLR